MLHTCPACGKYAPDLRFDLLNHQVCCPSCGYQTPIRRFPLFLVTGASCAGKSTLTRELFLHNSQVISMESDILWDEKWQEINDNFRSYRAMWLRVCQNISHAGKPVLLCGCCDPSQFAGLSETNFFTGLHFLAVVCRDEILEERMNRRGLSDPSARNDHKNFNRWFWKNHHNTTPPITLLDTSDLTPQQAAVQAAHWIDEILKKEIPHE
ncbi:MAG: AAA family ATPase [Candidatus Merdivicinus sp.]|jgi:hypothetical protein